MSNVIDIGDFRFTNKPKSYSNVGCKHINMTMDDNGDFVTCDDCNVQLSPWWVLKHILHSLDLHRARLNRQSAAQHEAEKKILHLKITQNLERIWRGKSVPSCPHCGEGILTTDGFGTMCQNKAMVLRRRQAKAEKK